MGLFRRLFQKTPQPISDPIALRTMLFDAANRRDDATVRDLCTANRALILQHFKEWGNVHNHPGVDVKNPRQMQFIINGLGKIAETFRDHLGEPSLWDRLTGSSAQSPFTRFEKSFEAAKALAHEMRHQEAIDLLIAYLIDIKSLAGPGADNFRAYSHGLIGMSLFQSKRAADALAHLGQALTLCINLNDKEGVGVYLRQLYDAHRYLGEHDEAASFADRLADHFDNAAEAQTWRGRAARIRAGEPLVRMTASMGEVTMELDEITALEGKITYFFERNRPTLSPSTFLVIEGEKVAAQGKYDEALGFFRDAAKADPYNPQPHYEAGVTLLLLQRYTEAVEEYEICTALAPGWFNVGSDLWVAQELLSGRLTHDAFLVAWAAENANMEPSEKLNLLEQALSRHPALPHLHFHRGLALIALDRKEEALAAFDAGLANNPEPDIHSRLLAQRAVLSDLSTRTRIFREILDILNPNMMSRTMAETMLRLPVGQ